MAKQVTKLGALEVMQLKLQLPALLDAAFNKQHELWDAVAALEQRLKTAVNVEEIDGLDAWIEQACTMMSDASCCVDLLIKDFLKEHLDAEQLAKLNAV